MKEKFIALIIITASLILICLRSTAQLKKSTLNQIEINMPVIWNNSEATYYELGNAKQSSGTATSIGLTFNYSKSFNKKLFGIIGLGYFNQQFNIAKRAFNFIDSTDLLFSTESYSYDNINWLVGVGYYKQVTKKVTVKGAVTFNGFNSFRQKYIVNKEYKKWQINHSSIFIAHTLNASIAIDKKVGNKISIGVNALLPVSTHWNNDTIFFGGYKKIANTKFSIGVSVSCLYNF